MAHPQEKYTISTPEVMVPQQPPSTTDLKKKSYPTKAIAAIVVGVAVVVGVCLCIYFFTKTTADIVEHYHSKCKGDHGVNDQDVENNLKENTILYHIHNETNEQWVLMDFNKNIQVHKVQNANSVCFLSPLNYTGKSIPEQLAIEMKANPPATDEVFDASGVATLYYTPFSDKIKDTSFLSPKAQDLCGNHDMYWIYPSCAETEETAVARRRRSAEKKRCCCKTVCNRYGDCAKECTCCWFLCCR